MASDPPGRAAGDAARPPAGTQLVRDRRRRPASPPRGSARRSIRLRLLLPVLVATVGLVALGIQQSLAAVNLADQGGKAQTVAATAVAAVQLEYQLEREVAESDALHQRGGKAGASLVTAARAQTDVAVAAFVAASGSAGRLSPGMRPLLDSARQRLDELARTRLQVTGLGADQPSAPAYAPLTGTLIAIADALPQQLSDAVLAAKARALVALVAAEHLGAQQRDLLHGVFLRHSYTGTELTQLASLVGQQQERQAEFDRNASLGQRAAYRQIWAGSDGATAGAMLGGALASPAKLAVDPEVWYVAQSNALRGLHVLQSDLSRDLDLAARSQQSIAQTKALVTAVSTAGLLLLSLATALLLAVRTSRRLRRLRATALSVAQVELPEAIAALSAARDLPAVRAAMRSASVRVEQSGVPGADEITEVGQALGQVHEQALRLAGDQAALRIDVAALFVALSRRGQSLVQRQLQFIDDFERTETDPHRLSRLFTIDHLAARMRRNEENLLVLAGGEPGRRITSAVALIDLVRAAAAEIEDYDRIDPVGLAEVAVGPTAARDLIHLLAELLENAAYFSPPTSRVRVTGRRDVDGLRLSVYDEGIGLTTEQLVEVNARLAGPTQLTAELAGTMGLLVVSRLAARHAIGVVITSARRGGTVAVVQVPNTLLAPVPSIDEHTAAMLRRSVGHGDVVEGEVLPPTQELPVVAARAAVTAAPAVPVPDPAATAPVPQSTGGAAPAGTPGYLPQRRPGSLLFDLPVPAGSTGATGAGKPDWDGGEGPPDPELVRARLAGLTSGLAAAARHLGGSPTITRDPDPSPDGAA